MNAYEASSSLGTPGMSQTLNFRDQLAQRWNPIKEQKQRLIQDYRTLQKNPDKLGLSPVEREKMLGEATRAATAQQQGQVTQMNQAALAGQGFQQGAFADAARDTSSAASEAAAKAAVGVGQLHQDLINKEKERILGSLDAAAQQTRENRRFWMQFGLQGIGGLFTAIAGSPLTGLSGAASGAAPSPPAGFTSPTAPQLGAGMMPQYGLSPYGG